MSVCVSVCVSVCLCIHPSACLNPLLSASQTPNPIPSLHTADTAPAGASSALHRRHQQQRRRAVASAPSHRGTQRPTATAARVLTRAPASKRKTKVQAHTIVNPHSHTHAHTHTYTHRHHHTYMHTQNTHTRTRTRTFGAARCAAMCRTELPSAARAVTSQSARAVSACGDAV